MNAKNTKKLFKRFKFFRPELSPKESLMCFGFSCDDGWYDLIYKLCEKIEGELKKEPNAEFNVCQVKEKFGGLRFYIDSGSTRIYKLISTAEERSYKICEKCGEGGKLRDDTGWYRTLCDECHVKRLKNGLKSMRKMRGG